MSLNLDQHGHLANRAAWTTDWAEATAQADEIKLTKDHWQVIKAVQQLFDETEDTPPMRLLIKVLKQRLDADIDSRFLYRLFPDNPVRQASKYAGLPKPKHCM
ncbi:TusE/DsrC/DsvC family sulfur relay protein [Marinicella rhabdoformis]|uniref:TusE/DsrC/DsvC family sulfur relay protein n=1 Tax=Marinicella rhabdoformis TaxID=2580566 RepID=UPI0012AEB540|nr:TusE/DsrC/DsvC family sulfur relay protein [Marinicella rhabdoformis]